MARRIGPPDDTISNTNYKWWLDRFKDNESRARAAMAWAKYCLSRQTLRYAEFLFYMQLFEDRPMMGLMPWNYTDVMAGYHPLKWNVIKPVANTYVSLITRSKPKPRVLTQGGDFSLKLKAKGITKWYDGAIQDMKFYERISEPAVTHSAIFGTGIGKTGRSTYDPNDDEVDVSVDLIYPWEMLVDDSSAQNPERMMTIGFRRFYDRDVLAVKFPKYKDFIAELAAGDSLDSGYDTYFVDAAADLVPVIELWRLPSCKGARDGRHVIVVEGKTLYDEIWRRDKFPFHFLYRDRPLIGVWGTSIPHELLGTQQYIYTTLQDIEDAQQAHAKPKWVYQDGSVNPGHLDDSLEGVIPFRGPLPPQRVNGMALESQTYQFLLKAWANAFDMIGVSQARASGDIDPGLSGSGESIRMANQVGDGRFYMANKNFQNWNMAIFDAMVEEARDIAEDHEDYASAYRNKTSVEIVRFRDVDPGRDKYYIATLPESNLSSLPAEREAQLTERYNSNIITADEYRELSGFPDIKAEDELANAPLTLTDKLISRFLEGDPDDPDLFIYPEAEWPLQMMIQRFQYALMLSRVDDVDDQNRQLLRKWIQYADRLMRGSGGSSPGGAPPGAPGAPTAGAAPAQPNAVPPPAMQVGRAMPPPK